MAYGEAVLGEGRVRIAGSLLPDHVHEPDELNDHRFGLESYALTYTGYTVFENLVDHVNPQRSVGVERLGGATRVETAVAVGTAAFPEGAGTVVLARDDAYPDALAGAPLAADAGGPLLLTATAALPAATAAELDRLGATRAVLLGGEAAIGEAVASALRDRGLEVERVAGANRFATAAAIATRLGRAPTAFVAEGGSADPARGFPDPLSAAPYAAATGRPVLLATADGLPAETAAALEQLGTTETVVVGGPAAVGEDVVAELAERGHGPRRLAGADRYATSLAVAEEAAAWASTARCCGSRPAAPGPMPSPPAR